ncbi:hypothetical protein I552_4372 [Mycobacterium xenopi 3993]|nr:hypothetical protein I552_4372 [Mycobacterium xenopi 3993]
MAQILGPPDEFPVHQLPQPIAWPGSSDRNFYDRSYLNAHDRTGAIFLITGIGYYPNLGVKDAFVLIRRGDTQTAVHLSDAIDQDRLNQHVGGYRIEVIEPLRRLRVILEETEGIAVDLTWQGLFDVVQEQPHVLRSGNRITLDAQRFAQLGSWSGRIGIDGEEIAVDPATWIGSRDRSWGIRPIGEPEPAGRRRPAVRGHVVAVYADGLRRLLRRADYPRGAQRFSFAQRLHPGLARRPRRAARLASGEHAVPFRHPHPDRGDDRGHHRRRHPGALRRRIQTAGPDPRRRRLRRRLGLAARHVEGREIHRAADLRHDRFGDHRAIRVRGDRPCGSCGVPRRRRRSGRGLGLYEHGVLGRHDPSGFKDWLTVAP